MIELPDIIEKITPVNDFEPKGDYTRTIDILPYVLTPYEPYPSYASLILTLTQSLVRDEVDEVDEVEEVEENKQPPKQSIESIDQKIIRFIAPVQPPQSAAQWNIYVRITYPVTRNAMFKVVFRPTAGELNLAMLYLAHATAYKMMYAAEDAYENGVCTDEQSVEPYGIWGHVIEDLVYNGRAIITISNDNTIVCDLDCDS